MTSSVGLEFVYLKFTQWPIAKSLTFTWRLMLKAPKPCNFSSRHKLQKGRGALRGLELHKASQTRQPSGETRKSFSFWGTKSFAGGDFPLTRFICSATSCGQLARPAMSVCMKSTQSVMKPPWCPQLAWSHSWRSYLWSQRQKWLYRLLEFPRYLWKWMWFTWWQITWITEKKKIILLQMIMFHQRALSSLMDHGIWTFLLSGGVSAEFWLLFSHWFLEREDFNLWSTGFRWRLK